MRDIRVVELFAGVGGFRLALEGYSGSDNPDFNREPAGPYHTVWANQWEPPGKTARQFAWRCYEKRFGEGSCLNEDIHRVVEELQRGERDIPKFDLLVGGFPCQDYSVAKPLSQASGIEGKKGVLWWDIYALLQSRRPRHVMLENVDRLLKSPKTQRGRDFAIILSCFAHEGYDVEWRVINAAEYGMPQRRRRVYIVAERRSDNEDAMDEAQLRRRLTESGIMAKAFPVLPDIDCMTLGGVGCDPYVSSESFGLGAKASVFQNAGIMSGGGAS